MERSLATYLPHQLLQTLKDPPTTRPVKYPNDIAREGGGLGKGEEEYRLGRPGLLGRKSTWRTIVSLT